MSRSRAAIPLNYGAMSYSRGLCLTSREPEAPRREEILKLAKVQVTNFRCIEDSNEFEVGPLTSLVGKNESGKTTILQALECLKPYAAGRNKYDKLRDYPRRYLADYDERHPEEAVALTTTWKLDQPEIDALEADFGAGCMTKSEVVVTKTYESETAVWSVPLDIRKALSHLVSRAGITVSERKTLERFESSAALHGHLAALPNKTDKHNELVKRLAGFRENDIELRAVDILTEKMPKFLYFSQYSKMSGDVSINQLRNDMAANNVKEGDNVFLAFLEFAGTTLDEIAAANKYEDIRARVEAASIKITDQIFQYWSQNQHLSIKFEIAAGQSGDPPTFNTGTVMHARVENALHRMTVPFSDRSAGFIWFFSFLVLFSQVKKTHGNIVILLDEPGLNLHAKAQSDLLRYIKEKLQPHHQVLYTTHSPFMIPPDNLASVRTVEDVVEQVGKRFVPHGTKVRDDLLTTDRDTLFPLQGALGYEITQTLFIGPHTLIVEGPGDVLYLQAASAALKSRGRNGLDSRWTLCPSGGLDKVNAFLSLFGGNRVHVAVLTDIAKGQKSKVENLRRSELLKAGHVHTVAEFCNQDEADVEDVLHPELFVAIINGVYSLAGAHQLTVAKLEAADATTPRRVKKAEAYFRMLPGTIPTFDHFTPAMWLLQHPELLAGGDATVTETLDRFQAVFDTFNTSL
jgi:predicted ATP-dependent endonuclease of OLD family